ncbi:MAG TPA: glycosyltransferase family 9 protein [Thermoanaerobaculia bacterium]|nr:glycosyltransferase family 9 protein [Thermoanaerobaculia bacterium]
MSRLLVLRLSALGDVIHTIPAVVSLKNAADVTWVVEAPYRELVEIVAGVEVLPVRMKKEPRAAIRAIRSARGFDASVDFQGLIKSAALGWLSGAKTRYGFDRHAIREKAALLFTNRHVRVDAASHVIDQNLQLASGATGSQPVDLETRRAESPSLQNWDDFAVPVPGYENSIVLLPGAGKANKLWPVERFRELAKRIGPRAVAAWGPGERELAEAIGARIAPSTNLRELAGLLQSAEVVIGGDTGPLHLADALGTKVIGLYGPTNPRRNGPYHQLQHCIDRFSTTKWMDSISVEEVMTMLGRVTAE